MTVFPDASWEGRYPKPLGVLVVVYRNAAEQ